MSGGEAISLASMVCFYNDEAGAAPLRDIVGYQEFGVGYIAASIAEDRRRVTADLFITPVGNRTRGASGTDLPGAVR